MSKEIKEIKIRIGIDGVTYEGLDDILIEEEYDWDYLRNLLQSLAEKKLILQKDHVKVILCPKCGSPHVYTKYACPTCQSSDVESIKLIEHPYCGYTGTKKSYISGSKLVCPKCKTELREVNRKTQGKGSINNYRIIGSTFECEACNQRFDRPNLIHICQNCGSEFNYKTAIYKKEYNYEIPIELIKKLRITDKILVLAIEDNSDDAELIKINLEKSEYVFKVEPATTGKEGLKKIKEKYYDVILLDYNLPDMKGKDFLEEMKIRKIETPVIVLTGADDRQIAVASMKLGAYDYLVKSAELFEELPTIIIKLIQK